MSTELIINASLPETRIALMEDGEIQDLLIERASGKGITGNIYKGRVTRVLPGMQAAFVDIGLEKAAFLYVDDVFVHSEVFEEEEEGAKDSRKSAMADLEGETAAASPESSSVEVQPVQDGPRIEEGSPPPLEASSPAIEGEVATAPTESDEQAWADEVEAEDLSEEEEDEEEEDSEQDDDEEDDDDDQGPEKMGPPPEDQGESGSGAGDGNPSGTVAPPSAGEAAGSGQPAGNEDPAKGAGEAGGPDAAGQDRGGPRRRHRRGRRGGRFRRRDREEGQDQEPGKQIQIKPVGQGGSESVSEGGEYPDTYRDQVADEGNVVASDRAGMETGAHEGSGREGFGRPEILQVAGGARQITVTRNSSDFKQQRTRDRRIKTRGGSRPPRGQVNIQDLLKEGQEVLVQVAKDPIATKGARLTCHISLPGRHLVCMPTIDHVGVSRRIERDDERRKLREYVERFRPRGLGFIVRTASGKGQSEKRIKQDVEYLSRLWDEIREKSANTTAPALVYEDLNSVLRSIRDWVTEEIDKIVVDSRYHYNEIQKFVSHFMPSLKQKVELYAGDVPVFDAYNISTELSRALERKVWLKSGGYLVVDQAEALVAIDVNTGRYVGKKNLEDTILKTNLEAVQEIAYQLRLRNCGGIIILDLIDMEREENKQRVYRALEEALKKDRARPSILKISELGLVEMTRKRTRDTMVRTLCESCVQCEGKGFIKSKQTVAYEVLREIEREGIERDVSKILVQAHQDVIDMLAIDERETLDQIERRYRKQVYLQAVTDFHPEQFEVIGDKKGEKTAGEIFDQQRMERDRAERTRSRGGRDRGERGGRRDGGGGGGRDRGKDREREPARERGPLMVKPRTILPADLAAVSTDGLAAQEGQPVEPRITPNPIIIIPNSDGGADAQAGAPVPVSGRGGDDFDNEEDRLAFLRAQATQDAAIARLGSSGDSLRSGGRPGGKAGPGGGGGGGGGRGGDRGPRGGGRGRRGGRFRGPGTGPGRGPGGGGGMGRGRDRDQRSLGPRDAPADAGAKSDGGAGDSGGGSTDSGGSSDPGHSNPPT